MTPGAGAVASFPRAALRRWYAANGRHGLPWRLTRDPYAVLVSEVMLQQTQVSRALPAWEAWMLRWPTAGALAGADASEVLRAWAGMGYNRRALNLHRAASLATATASASIPAGVEELRSLPGVGAYTAAAVASFAGGQRVAVLDTNVSRVIARHCFGAASQHEVRPAALAAAANAIVPPRRSATRDHNLALMDLGAVVCSSRSPACERCPLRLTCAWQARGRPPGQSSARPAPAFESTARFARGRIVSALRHAPQSEEGLRSLLPPRHAERLASYLSGLERDGLASRACDVEGSALWQLGPAQGNSSIASPKE